MGKLPNGPDAMDFVSYLLSMDAQSGLSTVAMLLPGGSLAAPSCSIHLLSSVVNGSVWEPMEVFRTSYDYPRLNCKNFEVALFKSSVEHDAAFGRAVFLKNCR